VTLEELNGNGAGTGTVTRAKAEKTSASKVASL
jgi:hypothetical protein